MVYVAASGGMGDANRTYILEASQRRVDNLHRGLYKWGDNTQSYIRSGTHVLPSPEARRPLNLEMGRANLEERLDFSYVLPAKKSTDNDKYLKKSYHLESSTLH